MNIVKIYGGLGNQMFQYAFGRTMKDVAFDVSWGLQPHDPPRPFHLDRLRVNMNLLTSNIGFTVVREENLYGYDPSYQTMNEKYFFGYWQNWKYINSILPTLREEFKVRQDYYTEQYLSFKTTILEHDNSVALHIRRGDYLTKGHHLLPLDYYYDCMGYLSKHFSDFQLFIFSDDIPWCREHIVNNANYVDLEDYLSLDLMRLCKHKITANSTFSLWAGVLGERKDSITFAPKRWRLNDTEENIVSEENFVPSNWIRL